MRAIEEDRSENRLGESSLRDARGGEISPSQYNTVKTESASVAVNDFCAEPDSEADQIGRVVRDIKF
jgi:hypothetical protein